MSLSIVGQNENEADAQDGKRDQELEPRGVPETHGSRLNRCHRIASFARRGPGHCALHGSGCMTLARIRLDSYVVGLPTGAGGSRASPNKAKVAILRSASNETTPKKSQKSEFAPFLVLEEREHH